MNDRSHVSALHDPKLTHEDMRLMSENLCLYRDSLVKQPALREAFEQAVEYAMGGTFEGAGLRMAATHYEGQIALSRVQAQLFLLQTRVQEWCDTLDRQTRDDPAIPHAMKVAESASLQGFAGDVGMLCAAIDNTLQIAAMPVTATRYR